MFGTRPPSFVIAVLAFAVLLPVSSAQPRANSELEAMVSAIVAENDLRSKEAIVMRARLWWGADTRPLGSRSETNWPIDANIPANRLIRDRLHDLSLRSRIGRV